jgi:hypothetical protein
MAIIDGARQIRGDLKAEIEIREHQAHENAMAAITQLDEGFTNITQIDPNVLTRLSADDYHTFSTLAKNNREGKIKAELGPEIDMVEVTNPTKFMSKAFVDEMVHRGATTEMIANLRTRQATKLAGILQKKPDPLSSPELWTIAKPAFEASGLLFDTQEAKIKTPAGKAERDADNRRKMAAVGYLRDRANEWAAAHPGVKPPEEEVRKWTGAALLRVGDSGQRLFEADNYTLYRNMDPNIRRDIMRELARQGIINNRTPWQQVNQLVADTYKRGVALQGYHSTVGQ